MQSGMLRVYASPLHQSCLVCMGCLACVCARARPTNYGRRLLPKIMFFLNMYYSIEAPPPPPSLPHPPIPPSDHRCVKIGIPQLPCGSKKRDHLHVRAKCSTRHDDDATIEHDLRSSCLTAEDAPRAGQTRIYIHILALKKNRSCIYSVNQYEPGFLFLRKKNCATATARTLRQRACTPTVDLKTP